MARQLAPKHFLRISPNARLGEYFRSRDLLTHITFEDRPETEIDEIYDGWQALPAPARAQVDADFERIDSLATEEGVTTLLAEAKHFDVDLEDAFLPDGGSHDKSFAAFLVAPQLFDSAWQIASATERPARYWFRRHDLPEVRAKTDENTVATLASVLSYYFQQSQGRGQVCVVEPYDREGGTYFFCYLADHGRLDMVFDAEDHLERQASRRAFEVIYLVAPARNALEIYHEGSRQTINTLQELFSRIVFGFDLPEPSDGTVYDLNLLKNRDFQFTYDHTLGITGVAVKKMRFTALGGIKRRVTLEADAAESRQAVYDLLEEVFDSAAGRRNLSSKLPLAAFNLTLAQLQVSFQPIPRRRAPTKTFQITHPNGCSLLHEGPEGAIREMLRRSGIERRAR